MARIMAPITITTSAGVEAMEVAGEVTIYTQAFKIGNGINFGVSAKAASSGTIALKVELEQSFKKPAIEGSADAFYAVPDNITSPVFSSISSATVKHTVFSPDPLPYCRFKITGTTGNDASTTLKLWVSMQEE